MTRLIPPPGPSYPADPVGVAPIGDLSAANGWALVDPTGLLANGLDDISVDADGLVTMTLAAVGLGVLSLIRPFDPDVKNAVTNLGLIQEWSPLNPGTVGYEICYGMSDSAGSLGDISLPGMESNATNDNARNIVKATAGTGNGGQSALYTAFATQSTVANRTNDASGRSWASMHSWGRPSAGLGNNRSNTAAFVGGYATHECLYIAVDGTQVPTLQFRLKTQVIYTDATQ